MNIAIVSPNQNAYSETFIQAHKNLLKGNIHYLYGGFYPKYAEKTGSLAVNPPIHTKAFRKVLSLLFIKKFPSPVEEGFLSYLSSNKIDVVLAEYGTTAAEIISDCAKLQIPLVVHFHGYDASRGDVLEHLKERYKIVFAYARKIISVSKVMSAKLLELGAPEGKIIQNTYGPDSSFFDIEPKFDGQYFLAIGRFVDKKAPYYTLLAFNEVAKKFPDVKLVYAGDGPLWSACKNLVTYLGISERVEFKGPLEQQELKLLMSSALGFVQHSIVSEDGDMEGTPVVILEASAAGLPVISTKHAGIPEVVVHEKTGFLVKEHDVAGMAEYMIKFLQSPKMVHEMGLRGRAFIKENFNMQKHISTLNTILDDAVKVQRPN